VIGPRYPWLAVLATALGMASALSSVAHAQDDEVSQQIWVDYNPRWTWPSGLELYGDVGLRTELGETGWGRIVIRPGLRGPVGPFRLSGGVGSFYTANEAAADRWEIRPFQGISATWPSKRIRLDHYLRLEERLEFEMADWTLDASLRLRYRLQAQFRWGGFSGDVFWRLILHGEAFATVTGEAGQFDERFRLGFAVERGFGPKFRARVDLTWQKVGAPFTGAPTDDLYIRVRAFHFWM